MASMDRFRSRLASFLLHLLAKVGTPIEVAIKGRDGLALLIPGRRLVLPPVVGGSPDDDDDDGGDGDSGDDDKDGDDSADSAGDDDDSGDDDSNDDDADSAAADADKGKTADDYRKQLRRYERSSKKRTERDKKKIADLEKALKEREDADKTEQQKAIDEAREKGKAEALTEVQKERRQDRLELAVTRQASRGIEIEVDGDDGKTAKRKIRFADPDDALVHLERMIAKGDVDEDDIYDEDHKVKKDGLTEALADLLDDKPHLRAGSDDDDSSDGEGGKSKKRVKGDSDAGKGSGSKGVEDLSVEELIKKQATG